MAAKQLTRSTRAATLVVAFSMTLAAVSAEAVTVKQVRKIARQEVFRAIAPLPGLQGPPGPQGPQGPPGKDGASAVIGTAARFVHIRVLDGEQTFDLVDENLSQGVGEENVFVRFGAGDNFPEITFFCIHGLPDPVHGAQVTAEAGDEVVFAEDIREAGVFTGDTAALDCQVVAAVKSQSGIPFTPSGAYIWIY